MKSALFTAILFSFYFSFAGDVYLCKFYSQKGGPQATQTEWKAKKDKICFAYKHDRAYPESNWYKLSIAKRVEKYYFARFINKDVRVKKGDEWTITSMIDDCGYILGEQSCTIK
jgi:hypothetical protein